MIRWITVLMLVVHSLRVTCAPDDPAWLFSSAQEREYIERASRLSNLHEYRTAISLARRACEEFPESVEAHLLRVSIAADMHELEYETEYYARESEEHPVNAVLQLALAACLYNSSNYPAAEEQLNVALSIAPQMVQARELQYLVSAKMLNSSEKPESLYDRLHANHPDLSRLMVSEVRRLGSDPANSQRKEKIIGELSRLPVIPPEYFVFVDRRAQEERWYDPASALPLLDKALLNDPSRVDVMITRADRLRRMGRITETIAALRRLVELAPRHAGGREELARILADQHRFEEAIQILAEGIPLIGDHDGYDQIAREMQAEYLYTSGDFEQTTALLQKLVQSKQLYRAQQARNRLVKIVARKKSEHIKLLGNVPAVTQKGYYCGPASMSMILGYWGKRAGQDSIADEVFTGVAGTAPEILRDYARRQGFLSVAFEGNTTLWKKLIDGGVPVLWLQMLGGWQAHYSVVTGYDEISKEFLVRDPATGREKRVGYSSTEDSWALPSLRHSIAFVPHGNPAADALSGIKATPRLVAFNRAVDVLTGANLFKAFPQGLVVNLCVAALLGIALMLSVNSCVFPHPRALGWLIPAMVVLAVAVLDLVIFELRSGTAVALLLVTHVSVIFLVMMFVILSAVRAVVADWFTWHEIACAAACVFGTAAAAAVVPGDSLQLWIVLAGSVLLFGSFAIPRAMLFRRIRRARYGPAGNAVEVLSRSAEGGSYACSLALVEACIKEQRWDLAIRLQRAIREGRPRWPRKTLAFFDMVEAFATVAPMTGTEEHGSRLEGATDLLLRISSRHRASSALGALARGLLVYLEQAEPELHDETAKAMKKWNAWPRLPGVPRLGFGPVPHVMLGYMVTTVSGRGRHSHMDATVAAVEARSQLAREKQSGNVTL